MASWAVVGETSSGIGRRGTNRNVAPWLMRDYGSDCSTHLSQPNHRLHVCKHPKQDGGGGGGGGGCGGGGGSGGGGVGAGVRGTLSSSQLIYSNKGADNGSGCCPDVQLELCSLETLRPLHHDCSKSGCQRVIINVSGQRYETQLRTLGRYPNTLLGDPVKRKRYWDVRRNEVFIDRHRPTFQAILYYYQSGGRLRRPFEVPEDIFIEELEFYEIDDEIINQFKTKEGFIVENKDLPSSEWQREIWLICEEPDSSLSAKAFAFLSVTCILVSIVNFCTETIPTFSERANCVNVSSTAKDGQTTYRNEHNYRDPFFLVESVCVAWFTMEFLLRLVSCPSKRGFCKDVMNIFDVLAIVPFFITLITMQTPGSCEVTRKKGSFLFTRVLRVFRIFKLSKHSHGLRILGLTIKTSMRELGMFFFFLAVAMVIFSSAAYYAEAGQEKVLITSIPDGFWWAIVTMTTVGYGDLTPVGIWGKLVGTFCVIAGVLTIALPVPVVVANFNNFYRHASRGGVGGGLGG